MPDAPGPDEAYDWFEREIDVLENAWRTGAPTQDLKSKFYYALPYDDFVEALRAMRDEIEERAYLAIVAAVEGVLQLDFRVRARGKASVPLRNEAKKLIKNAKSKKRRIELEPILDAWKALPGIRQAVVSDFKQLLDHRHWLAHGRYFPDHSGVSDDPGFAIERSRTLLIELRRMDESFPRE